MDRSGEQLQLARAFLGEARHAFERVLRPDAGHRDPAWRQRHLEAMIYWARAYRHYRACSAAQHRVTTQRAA
jgi:hypothetical protein